MFPVFALYRESKVNQSPFYRFLCHYKILEGVYKKLRHESFTKAKQLGIEVKKKKELVPEHPEIRQWLPDYIGKSIPTIWQNELTRNYRNEIAHFLLDNGSFMNVSDNTIRGKFEQIIILTEICVQLVLEYQNGIYDEIKEKTKFSKAKLDQ